MRKDSQWLKNAEDRKKEHFKKEKADSVIYSYSIILIKVMWQDYLNTQQCAGLIPIRVLPVNMRISNPTVPSIIFLCCMQVSISTKSCLGLFEKKTQLLNASFRYDL